MATPTGTKYYTYKPGSNVTLPKGNTPHTAANTLKLNPGETVGHNEKGYYSVPGAVTAPPPVAAPKAGGWTTPNYGAIIAGDWELGQAQAQGAKDIGGAETDFQKRLRQAFIDFGASDTSRLGEYAKYIDNPTIEAAKQNKFSTLAQNLKAQTANLRQGRAALAARGMLSSGQTTNDTLTQEQGREQADYGGLRDFLGGADQGTSQLASLRQSIADRIAAARQSAADRAYQDNPATWNDPGSSAAPLPGAASGISWGGKNGITTVAGLKSVLAPGVTYAQWAANHPAAAAKLK